MEKKCDQITFDNKRHSDEKIIALILNCNETEGYSIKNEGVSNGMTHIIFENTGCCSQHHLFIKEGKIYCRNIKSFITDILDENEIHNNTANSIDTPPFIIDYLVKKYLPTENSSLIKVA